MSKFIVLEGIDGAGKTTLARTLVQAIQNAGQLAVLHREPTEFATGKKLREYLSGARNLNPDQELELFLQDRQESVNRNICPNLKRGVNVILDRYYYSTAAYQANANRSPADILARNLAQNFPAPDVILYLDIDPSVALERIRAGRENFDRFENWEKLTQIRANYEMVLPPTAIRLDARRSTDDLIREIQATVSF